MSRAHIFFYEHFSFLRSESACHLSKKSYFYFLELQLDLWFYILDKSLDIYLKGYSAAAFSKVKTSCIIVPIKFFQDVFANYVGGWCGQNLTSRDAASCPRERIGSSLKYIENWIYPFRAWDMYCYVIVLCIIWLIDWRARCKPAMVKDAENRHQLEILASPGFRWNLTKFVRFVFVFAKAIIEIVQWKVIPESFN